MKRFVPLLLLSTACVDTETAPCPATPKLPALHSGLEVAGPSGLDPKAIDAMMKHARASGTDAVVVLKDGKIAIEEYFSAGKKPIMAMSASKSISSLAIGALAHDDPKLSLDEPIAKLFPDQKLDEERSKITLRHILTHTSGAAVERAEWWKDETFEKHFWTSPMKTKVGEDFRYNNNAVDFLSSYVHARTKRLRLDDVLQRDVFGPIGVRGATWRKDPSGDPGASGELEVEPLEFAKLGLLMLQDGVWEGKRLLREGWVAESTRPSQSFNEAEGYLWWLDAKKTVTLTSELLASYEKSGVPAEIVRKLRPLVDKAFACVDAMEKERATLLSEEEQQALMKVVARERLAFGRTKLVGPVRAYYANGWIGQFLVVVPSKKLVAVRMREASEEDMQNSAPHEYPEFTKDVRALVGDLED